jgi:hypothetical protein
MHKFYQDFLSLTLIEKITIALSVFTLVLSFFFPAFYIDRPENPAAWSNGCMLFFFGWTFPLGGALVPFFFWLANPIYIFSIISIIRKKNHGYMLSYVPLLLALIFSQMKSIMTSESGSETDITSFELGYFLWLSSFAILAIGVVLNTYIIKKRKPTPHEPTSI